MSFSLVSHYMQEALNLAKIAQKNHEVPVGCVIVENNQIIAKAFNQNITSRDPSAHAEIVAIRQACTYKNSHQLPQTDIYITLEPCLMCLGAISYARIKRIYYGANDPKFGAIESNPISKSQSFSYFQSEIYSGICAQESSDLLRKFFLDKR